MALAVLATSCSDARKTESEVIGRQNPIIVDGRMTPEVLWSFGRIGSVNVSPSGERIVYTVTYFGIPENRSNSEIFVMNADGSGKKQITRTSHQEVAPRWMNDNEHIAFLSNESGSMQLWKMRSDGSARRQISNRDGGMSAFRFSPDESRLLFVSRVKYGERIADIHPDLPKANAKLITDLMYKHWDEWVENIPQPFIADFNGRNISNERNILEGTPYQSPMMPFGGIEQLAWSPDGKTVAYTSKKKTGMAFALSTNSDIYFFDIATGTSTNMTDGIMGYDRNPTFSPCGKWLAWESMEHDGRESDKARLFIMNLTTGKKAYLTGNFPESVSNLTWSADGRSIYFISSVHAVTHIYRADINFDAITENGDCAKRVSRGNVAEITQITDGIYNYVSIALAGDRIIAGRQSMSKPTEIYSVNTQTGEATELSFENKHILDQLTMGKVEKRWITTTDNKQMLTWVVFPPHFDPNKQYPAILYCQGGPQSPVSQFWSYRWNMQMIVANDYILVMPNRRGVPGFGMEWLEQISGDYGGQNKRDLLSAIDAVSQEPFVDADRLGAIGASYGGFSVFWLAGNHEGRFRAFISHNGLFNFHQMYLTTEEMFFVNRDFGGAFWEKDNAVAQRTFAASPHNFVGNWDTPILIVIGEKDYRVPHLQGAAAFAAAKLQGIPAQMLVFPEENHWVLQPQNGILWQRTFFNWLDKWLK